MMAGNMLLIASSGTITNILTNKQEVMDLEKKMLTELGMEDDNNATYIYNATYVRDNAG